ncbi:outer membrane protein [Bartonella doshiae]|uniref:outer membrane protein n=1 Tax=Bartonella doshiae TaxID=33044 RepID=UPI001ABAE39E|nr:outer membrane beta-barrel protein [Bartonella doshiae]
MNTKRLITASIFTIISASAAQAADVMVSRHPVKAVSPTLVAPAFSWTGFYLGLQAGGFSSKSDMNIIVDKNKSIPLSKDLTPKLSAFSGGFYAGINIDLGDNFVFGIDTDLVLSGKKETKSAVISASDNAAVDNLITRSRRSAPAQPATPAKPAPAQPATPVKPAPAQPATPAKPAPAKPAPAQPATPAKPAPAQPVVEEVQKSAGVSSSNQSSGLVLARSAHSGTEGSSTKGVNTTNSGDHSHGVSHGSGHGSNSPHGSGHGSGHYHGAHSGGVNPHNNTHNVSIKNEKENNVYGVEQITKLISALGFDHSQDQGAKVFNHTLKENWAGSTRVRIGFAADRIMPYIAGGISYVQLQDIISVSLKESDKKASPAKELVNETNTMIGYTLGGGIDFAMTDNVVLRAEYRYSDFGKKKFAKEKLEINYKTNEFHVGVAYKF